MRRAGLALAAGLVLATAARADEISVTQYGTSFLGVPYTVAQAEGLFAKAGADITGFIGSGGGGTTVRNLMARCRWARRWRRPRRG